MVPEKSQTTETYCITFEVRIQPGDLPEIERRMECARQVYNTCLGRCLTIWKSIRANPLWRQSLSRLQSLNWQSQLSDSGKTEQKGLRDTLKRLEHEAGLTEYAMHAYALNVTRHFGNPLGSNELQKAATFAWRTFDRLRFGNARKVRFKRRDDPITIENKCNTFGLRLKGTMVLWGSRHTRTLQLPLIIDKGDTYAEQTFLDETKFVRLFFRKIRGERRLFVQVLKKGTPPAKKRTEGTTGEALGIDASPSTLVVWSKARAIVEELAPECEPIEKELRRLNRAIDRSYRATNPDAYHEDGTIQKGARLVASKRCQKLIDKRSELFRKQRAIRKQSHEAQANRLIALSGDIRVENTPITSWTRRAKKTTVNSANGRIRSKKRYGKTIAKRAPGMLLAIIDRKLHSIGLHLKRIDSYKVKASQFDHSTGQCTKKRLRDRWGIIDGHQVQRDLYSAFLIAHTTGKNLDAIDREACNADWMTFLHTQDEVLKSCDRHLGIFK